jgi:hypothetical protein
MSLSQLQASPYHTCNPRGDALHSEPSAYYPGLLPPDNYPSSTLLSSGAAVYSASLGTPDLEIYTPKLIEGDRSAYFASTYIPNPEYFEDDRLTKEGGPSFETISHNPISNHPVPFAPTSPNLFSIDSQLVDLIPLSPPSSEPPSPSTSTTSDSSISTPEPSSPPTATRLRCSACKSTFAKNSSLNRHQESVHGRKEARKLLRNDIKWWEARALMDMAVRKHSKDKALQRVLKDAVLAFKSGERLNVPKFESAFLEFARLWLEESTCPFCQVEFSRRDAADRKHRCIV